MTTTLTTRSRATRAAFAALAMAFFAPELPAQHLHTNNRWKDCAFVIDSSLTQGAWHQFVSELGLVMYFRPLDAAQPLGKGHVEVAVLDWRTRIDDSKDAWNNTFSHPNAEHELVKEGALKVPGLMVRGGLTDRVDVGAYVTRNFDANYGVVGAQVQFSLRNDARTGFAVATRASAVALVGPEDLTSSVYGLDLVVSRKLGILSPYASVSGFLSHGHERTSKVNLADENVLGAQATLGVAARISRMKLGAEYNLARVSGYAFRISVGS